MRRFLAVVATALAILIINEVEKTIEGDGAGKAPRQEEEPDQSWRIWGEDRPLIPFSHRWRDETVAMLEWREDTVVIDRDVTPPMNELESTIDRGRLWATMNRYGLPENWPGPMSDPEFERRFASLVAEATGHGVTITRPDGRIRAGPDYRWLVEEGRGDLRDYARQLGNIAGDESPSSRQLVRTVAAFVQSFDYKIPATTRRLAAGDTLVTFGVMVPLELLYHKWGDCDSKSVLFSAILGNVPGASVVFLAGFNHLFVGVREIPREGDHYIVIQGVPYVLIELTEAWPVGRVPREVWARVRQRQLVVMRVLGDD